MKRFSRRFAPCVTRDERLRRGVEQQRALRAALAREESENPGSARLQRAGDGIPPSRTLEDKP